MKVFFADTAGVSCKDVCAINGKTYNKFSGTLDLFSNLLQLINYSLNFEVVEYVNPNRAGPFFFFFVEREGWEIWPSLFIFQDEVNIVRATKFLSCNCKYNSFM